MRMDEQPEFLGQTSNEATTREIDALMRAERPDLYRVDRLHRGDRVRSVTDDYRQGSGTVLAVGRRQVSVRMDSPNGRVWYFTHDELEGES